MKKIIISIFALIFAFVNVGMAEDGYLKFNKETELKGKIFYEGEIYQIIFSAEIYKFKLGEDVYEIGVNAMNNVEKILVKPLNKEQDKNKFVEKNDDGTIHIDLSAVGDIDEKIKIVSEDQKTIVSISSKSKIDLNKSILGNNFRLIIPNCITIYYDINKLTNYSSKQQKQEINSKQEKPIAKSKTGFNWWPFIIFIFFLLTFALYYIWKKNKDIVKESDSLDYVKYKGGSLKEFAENYGGLDYLSSLDENIPDSKTYNNLCKEEREKLKNKLLHHKIIIKTKNETNDDGVNNDDMSAVSQYSVYDANINKSSENNNQSNYDNNSGIKSFLPEIRHLINDSERRIINEIINANSGSVSFDKFEKVRIEKQKLESDISGLKNELNNLNEKVSSSEKNFQNSQGHVKQLEQKIRRLDDLDNNVISLDFLKPYAETVFDYLKFCQQVTNEAFNTYTCIIQQNQQQAIAPAHLFMQFQSSVNNIPFGNWLQIVEDIKDTGATTNRQIRRSFSQITNDSDCEKEFKRLLFSQLLLKYSGNLLILIEAYRNLTRFQGANKITNEARNTFSRYVTEILSKAKATGMELKYVPLFENYDKYGHITQSKSGPKSMIYTEISGLKRGDIAEIVSIGVKTIFDDSTRTIIIIE